MKKTATATQKRVTTPRTARNDNDFNAMERTVVETSEFWMITDGYTVSLAQQKKGQPHTGMVSIPREVFDAFADWYMTGAWIRPRKRRAA